MAFDLATARPVKAGGFDLATAKPVDESGGFMQGVGNLAAGAVRGAGSIGATVMRALPNALGGDTAQENAVRRQSMDDALQSMGAEPDSWMYQGGKLGGEIAGTAGAGGVAGNAIARLANVAGYGAKAAPLVQALQSSGMTTGGGMSTIRDLAMRTGAGATVGGISAGMVDPRDSGIGAMIGGALPGALKVAGAIGRGTGDLVRYVKRPPETHLANKLAQSLGMSADELAQTVTQRGPGMIPGYQATVPQILQNPITSQLQRTLKTAGANGLGDAERVQQGAYRNALERVAPIDLTVQDAAQRAGGALEAYAKPAHLKAGEKVDRLFEAVDPFNESALYLPIDEMMAQKSRYLGEGTFGTGGKAAEAIATAKRVGTQEIPAVAPLAKETANNSQTLEKAVRSMGGMKGGSGELRDLGIKQSGTTGLINNKTGKSADLVAEEMHRRGFIPDNDPATLMDALRNGGGRKIYANDQVESNGMQRLSEFAMGDAPGAETIAKTVPFNTVQNLRSSMNEAWKKIVAKDGATKESAALKKMIDEVDFRINRAAGGSAAPGEFFAKDMADTYREALAAHGAKKAQFETGPQIGMFRQGGDGQTALQGAEIPGKFFSGRRSQVEDVKAFKKLIGNRSDLADELKRYAVTEGAGTSNVAGDLTSKYLKWMESRSGASRELFTEQELATLKEVGKAVERGIGAESLGRVSGSDTAQKLEALNNLGLLDSKTVNLLATRIPGIGAFTGPMLSRLRETAAGTRNNALSKLLANPDELVQALQPGSSQRSKLMQLMDTKKGQQTLQMLYRTAPVTYAQ